MPRRLTGVLLQDRSRKGPSFKKQAFVCGVWSVSKLQNNKNKNHRVFDFTFGERNADCVFFPQNCGGFGLHD